jgi:peptidoglycan/LPS O-acetylase OafA/YrhL
MHAMAARNAPPDRREPLIDLFKVFATQTIVLHHLTVYGGIAAALHTLAPGTVGLIFDYGRYVVHGFLAIAGYLAGQTLRARTDNLRPLSLIGRRYLRLIVPFAAAMAFAIFAAWIARFSIHDDYVGDSATPGQILAHLLLLQDILGIESFSAGMWYVAIDFQLFAFLTLLRLVARNDTLAAVLIGGFVAAALLHYNRNPNYDSYFIYFVGSYGLGALAEIAGYAQTTTARRLALGLIAIFGLVIGLLTWNGESGRALLALVVTLCLLLARIRPWRPQPTALWQATVWASDRSYWVFVLHYSLVLIANAAYARLEAPNTVHLSAAVVVVCGASWWMAGLLYRHVEIPTHRTLTHWNRK